MTTNKWWRRLLKVRIVAKLLTCVLLLLVAGVPVMACMQPDATLTADEMACCKQMANDCSEMGGQSSGHDCCKKTDIRTHVAVVQPSSTIVGIDPVYVISSLPTEATGNEQVNPLLASFVHEYSPPESPPGFNQILRI
jgi:hypothetical protein